MTQIECLKDSFVVVYPVCDDAKDQLRLFSHSHERDHNDSIILVVIADTSLSIPAAIILQRVFIIVVVVDKH